MEQITQITELYLPYKGAIINHEVVEDITDNLTNHPHPQRPSTVIAS